MAEGRYEFGSAGEDRTFVLGLRGAQLAVLAAGLVFAVGLLRTTGGSRGGFAVAAAVVGVAAVVAMWPVGGRTLEEWTPVAFGWALQRLARRRRHVSVMPLLGHDARGKAEQRPPPSLGGMRVVGVPLEAAGGFEVGVAHDRQAATYAAVLAVRGRSFQFADTPERQRRLAAWGRVLAGLARAGSPIHRLQWVERTAPEDADAMGRYLIESRRVPREHPSLVSYLELVDGADPADTAHETFLVVSISAISARRAIRQAGGRDEGAARVLVRELLALRRQLAAADVTVEGILTPRLLAGAIRTAFDPHARGGLARRAAAAGDEGGCQPANAWPLATETTWSAYHTADVWHATYWVAQWPRSPVGSDFLAPLLLGTTSVRTVAVTLQPVNPLRAHREVEHAVLKSQADEELLAQTGFAPTARRRRAAETAARREAELAHGHADYRLAGYITVTAPTLEGLEAACGEVEQAAQQSFLELRRLYGQQDIAFTSTLPLARGLR